MRRITASGRGILWLAALVISLSWAGAAGAAETIKLGAAVPLTGRYAAPGAQNRNGYELAVEAINKAGGVNVGGKRMPLELILLDDESDATKTVARFETLHASNNVMAYLGTFGSDLHAAAAAVADKNKVPYCGVAFALYSIHQRGYRYLFSPFWKSPDIARETFVFLNAMLPDAQRPKKVALFLEKTDWGKEMDVLWTAGAREFEYEIVLRGEYAVGTKDFSDIILKAKAARAEAMLSIPNPPDGMAIVKQMKELDFNPKFQLIIRAPDAPVWSKNLGKDGDFVTLGPGWHHAVKWHGVSDLNEAHTKRVGRPADPIAGPSYACVQIVANAIQRAGSLDRDKIRDAMAATDMLTVAGPVKFRPDGTGIMRFILLQWQNGKQELIWPKEFATAPFQYPAPPFNQR